MASRINITKFIENIFAKLKSETNVLTLKFVNKYKQYIIIYIIILI